MKIAGIPVRVLLPWVRAYLLVTLLICFWMGFFQASKNPVAGLFVLLMHGQPWLLLEQIIWEFIPNLLPIPLSAYDLVFFQLGGDESAGFLVRSGGMTLLKIAQIALIVAFVRRLMKARPRSPGAVGLPVAVSLLHLPSWLIPLTMTFGIILTLGAVHVAILFLSRGAIPEVEFLQRWFVYVGLFFGITGTLAAIRFNASAAKNVLAIAQGSSLAPEHPLAQRVQNLATRVGLPPVAVTTMPQLNAFAIGSSRNTAAVALGRPLVNQLEADEVDAVIGHELGHIVSSDMNRMQLAMGFEAMFDTVGRAAATISQASIRDRQTGTLVVLAIHLLRSIVLLSSTLVTRYISRMREYRADAIGAALSSPEAMIRALERVHGVKHSPTPLEQQYGYLMFRGGALSRLFSTHPTLEQRVKKLKKGSLRLDLA